MEKLGSESLKKNGLYHIGLEVVKDGVTKQSGWDSIELIDLMRLV